MTTDNEYKILESCDALFPDVINFTKDMVREYAVLHQEQGVLGIVEKHMQGLGLPTTRVPMDHHKLSAHPMYAPVEWDGDDKYNIVSALNSGAAGKSLVLNGHLDVVSAEPFDMWTRPPNEPWEKDGWLYGRGTGDMQSGVAAMIYAVHAITHAGFKIKSPLTIHTVVEEECSGNGALACLQHGYDGDFVLIPEPFGPQIYAGQLGVLWFKLDVYGTPVHVLDTSAGENAIEKMMSLIPYLKELEAELNAKHRRPPYDQFDHPFNLNIGTFNGGNWASSVPAHAAMEARIGFPVGMPASAIMRLVSECIDKAAENLPAFKKQKPKLSFHGFRSEGHLVDLENPGIQMLEECHKSLTNEEAKHILSTCTTDLRAFQFHSNMTGTCYGPVAQRIHGVDECVDIESIRHTLKTYALFISRWCDIETL